MICFCRNLLWNDKYVEKGRFFPIVCPDYLAELSFYAVSDRCNAGLPTDQDSKPITRLAVRSEENRKCGTAPFAAGLSDKRNFCSLRQAGSFGKAPVYAHYLYVVSETVNILRPFFRRLLMTFLPPLVSILFLKPCVFTLLRFDG